MHEVAVRHAGARLDGARRVEHPRRLHRRRRRATGRRLPPTRNLHVVSYCDAGRAADDARRAAPAPAHAARPARPDPVPHVVLRRATGASASASGSSTRCAPGDYEVCIDSTLEPGHAHLRRGRRAGTRAGRVPRSRPTSAIRRCADDNLSGIAVSAHARPAAARRPAAAPHVSASSTRPARSARSRGSPATATRRTRIAHGLTLSCLGDDHPFTYKRTRRRRRT